MPERNDAPEAMRRRIEFLCRRYSQSEIARRTGVPVSSVNRYLGGARIPAEFCGSLVRELDVNPAWMLTGEGAPWLSEVGAGTQQMAGDLMELVEAMNAVERMRLGSLSGRDHLKLLRRLSDALKDYESLKRRLNDHSRPIFERVLNDWRAAMNTDKLEESISLRKASHQVARMCEDAPLRRLQTRLEAQHEMLFGDGESSLHYARRALMGAIATDEFPTDELLEEARRFCIALRYAGRLKESLRYVRAFLTLAANVGSEWRSYVLLQQFEGYLLFELGELSDGLAIMRASLHKLSGAPKEASECAIATALFLTGVANYESLQHFGTPCNGRAMTLVEFAVWIDEPDCLRHSLNHYDGPPQYSTHIARALLAARSHKSRALAAFTEATEPEHRARNFEENAALAQVAWRCGHKSLVEATALKADAELRTIPPEITPSQMVVAAHHRTVLRALDARNHAGVRARARAYFEDRVRQGFGLYKSVLAQHAT
ncbi:MAG: hypothetical protein KF696_07000 [Planctomycetes bacterium]|nr:hypothetical protein [Planctomycetota bacterium]MCW8135303.1 hypothetical protein [Planctomycetota bacterium]